MKPTACFTAQYKSVTMMDFKVKEGAENMLIIYMKKLLDSDWLRAVQFKCNTSAKSVTPVQKV